MGRFWKNARASPRRWRCPAERGCPPCPRGVRSPSGRAHTKSPSAAASSASATDSSEALPSQRLTFSERLAVKICGSCGTYVMRFVRVFSERCVRSNTFAVPAPSASRIFPSVGAICPVRRSSSVDLPMPLAPASTVALPAGKERVRSVSTSSAVSG